MKAIPHHSHEVVQTAHHAKNFRDISQKCSAIHQECPALFGASHKNFFGALHHLELCGVALDVILYILLFLQEKKQEQDYTQFAAK